MEAYSDLDLDHDQKIVESLLRELFPALRSITGSGFKKSALRGLKAFDISATEMKVASGSKVFDWTVPAEWDVDEAWVKNSNGKKIIDIKNSSLEILNFSSAFHGIVDKKELLNHLHTLPDRPEWIPYRTSYYEDNWGFCCKHSLILSEDFSEPFEIYIDSRKNSRTGNLYWYESLHQGETDQTILISTYICHPALANDNLSGFLTSLALFNYIKKSKTRFSYKLVIVPETIGALSFLQSSKKSISKIVAGFVVTTTAGKDSIGIKKTFLGNHWLDKISIQVGKEIDPHSFTYNFAPDGSDERQYSSPEFRIPTISITNSKYHEYDEYHTSADNLEYISIDNFKKNLLAHIKTINRIEMNVTPRKKGEITLGGEFQLGKRGLFPNIGGGIYQKVANNKDVEITSEHIDSYSWLMHLIDGKTSVLEISEKSGIEFTLIYESLQIFQANGLVDFY
jgi:aminopeptidase-like protein